MKRTVFCHYAKCTALAVLMCLVSFTSARSQNPAATDADSKASQEAKDSKKAAKPYTLTVKTQPILNISLKANKAKMGEVAQELSKKLKTPVFLGKARQNELISIEFSDLTFEPAMQLMSPTVYVDYEIQTGSTAAPKPLGIYFYDLNQGEPPLTAVVQGASQSLLIEGNTEDGVETGEQKEEEQPLKVFYQNYQLSIKAKKQPLSLVLLKIGEELGIPVDLQDEGGVLVDADISKVPVEDAIRQLSPNIRLFVRADLTRAEKRTLRIVLNRPSQAAQQN